MPRFSDYRRVSPKRRNSTTQYDEAQAHHLQALTRAVAEGDQTRMKQVVDEMWLALRDVLQQASSVEEAWSALAPRAMPAK